MAAQKTIVIAGITGNQGGSVADSFLASSTPWRIRALTRNPSSAAAKAWTAKGVSMVRADLDDPASLREALAGATAVFSMTDFWTPMADPATHAAAAEKGVSPNQYCHDLEVSRGLNLAKAAKETEGLERFVWSSLSAATKWSKGKYKNLWHFDGKAEVERWVREDAVLGPKASFVQVGLYVDNWKVIQGALGRVEGGGFASKVLGDGRAKIPFVWTRRDTGVVVRKLIEDLEPGKSVLAYSEFASWREFMAKFKKVLGVELGGDEGIVSLSFEELKEGIPGDEDMKNEIAESSGYFEDFGYDGGDPDVLHPKDVSNGSFAPAPFRTLQLTGALVDWCRKSPHTPGGVHQARRLVIHHVSGECNDVDQVWMDRLGLDR